jgi:pimeloyl-ACP methyl ester carboxylesterase
MELELNGARVHVGSGGRPFDPNRPSVVFLHGSGLDHTFWSLHSRYFAFRGYSVLAPDLPGHSLSGGAPLDRIESMADWLHALVQALGARNLSLVGHSQGCLVALEFCARYRDSLRSLSCIASGLATPVNPALIDAAKNAPDKAVELMTAWGFGPAGQRHLGPVPGNAMLVNGQKIMRKNAPAALAADLEACDRYQNGAAAAAAVRCPAQVLIADMDRMAPRKATAELVAALSEPTVVTIGGSGHMLPLEAPDRCRAALSTFIFAHNPA